MQGKRRGCPTTPRILSMVCGVDITAIKTIASLAMGMDLTTLRCVSVIAIAAMASANATSVRTMRTAGIAFITEIVVLHAATGIWTVRGRSVKMGTPPMETDATAGAKGKSAETASWMSVKNVIQVLTMEILEMVGPHIAVLIAKLSTPPLHPRPKPRLLHFPPRLPRLHPLVRAMTTKTTMAMD